MKPPFTLPRAARASTEPRAPGSRQPWRDRLGVLRAARATGAIALLVVGGVHLEQYTVAQFSAIPTIGPLFVVNFIAATATGVILLMPVGAGVGMPRLVLDSAAALTGIGVALGALVALLISEHTRLFGFMEHGYRLEIVTALVSEGIVIVSLGLSLACARHWARRLRRHAVVPAVGAPTPQPAPETWP
jgi:hypothetical protein